MDTGDNELLGLDDFEFFSENSKLDVDAVFQPKTDTLLPLLALHEVEIRSAEDIYSLCGMRSKT